MIRVLRDLIRRIEPKEVLMDRRSFVAAMGSAILLPACAGNGARSSGSLNRIGLQLYTVRDQMEVSVERCLRDVARIGFREVEFAGYFGRPPRSIRQLLDRNGLKSPSAHVSFETLTSGWFRTLDQAAEIGHKWLVVPSLAESERNSIDALMRTAERLNRAAEDAETFDIGVAYHNHDFEFEDVEGRRIFDVLLGLCGLNHPGARLLLVLVFVGFPHVRPAIEARSARRWRIVRIIV